MFKILAPHFSRKNNKSREHLIYSLLIRFRNFFLSKLWRFKDHPIHRFFVVSATKLSFPFFSFGWKYSYSKGG